jgi:hypothetical protein
LLVGDETAALIYDHPCKIFEVVLNATESRLFYLRRKDATEDGVDLVAALRSSL